MDFLYGLLLGQMFSTKTLTSSERVYKRPIFVELIKSEVVHDRGIATLKTEIPSWFRKKYGEGLVSFRFPVQSMNGFDFSARLEGQTVVGELRKDGVLLYQYMY